MMKDIMRPPVVGVTRPPLSVGVVRPVKELVGVREAVGVRRLVGVCNKDDESLRCRDDGVCGKTMVFASDLEGVPSRLEGVMGNGTAKSCWIFLFVGDFDRDREGEWVGELGVSSMVFAEGDLGDEAARSFVSVDAFAGVGSAGRSANGTPGMGDSTALS